VNHQVHDAVRLKVGNANGFDLALLVQFFHRAPFAIYITIGLMDKIQVNIIQLQAIKDLSKALSMFSWLVL
jgi:hypothetical protein